jgi:hypothetical protein
MTPTQVPRHLTNIPAEDQRFAELAAINTGFKILVNDDCRDARGESYESHDHVSVWTYEGGDHTKFWDEYERLKRATRTCAFTAMGPGGGVTQ